MKRIVVLGLMGRYPLGGMAWQVLHHVVGLQRLGYRCAYLEDSGAYPYSPRLGTVTSESTEAVRFLRDTFRRFDLAEEWGYRDHDTGRWHGMPGERARELLEHADVVLNLCGASPPERLGPRKGCLVYVQTDPGRDLVELAAGDPLTRASLDAHDLHFTYAENLGEPDCPLPSGDIAWRKTRPPVLADLWECSPRPRGSWRSIATWENHDKDFRLGGEVYRWSKRPSFARVIDLPARTEERLELALLAEPVVLAGFVAHGWKITDPYPISRTALGYRRYVHGAKGEFSVEKDSYVRTRSGWFSDRTVCFLASGRPCVIQDTGFGDRVPSGNGLLAWASIAEAQQALERVAKDYERHARAARQLALDFFDARILLPPMLEAAGI